MNKNLRFFDLTPNESTAIVICSQSVIRGHENYVTDISKCYLVDHKIVNVLSTNKERDVAPW